MKQRTLFLLLAAAVALSLLGVTALAAGGDLLAPDSSVTADSSGEEDDPAAPDSSMDEDSLNSPEPLAETDPGEAVQKDSGAGEEDGEEPPSAAEEYIPDPVGSISFKNMGPKMREGNLNVLYLEETIQAIRAIDYDELQDDVRKGLNEIANEQWKLIQMSSNLPMGIGPLVTGSASMQLQAQYDATREMFDDIKDGKLQADNEDLIWQLSNAQDQVIMAGEALYIALLDMENTDKNLDRQLAALDRQLEELELRYELGHISSQTLKQAQAGRTALVSGQQTLKSNIKTYKMQLELLIGAEISGNIRLGAVSKVSDKDLSAMDLEADLEAAKKASYSLYEAKQTLDDAEEDFKDAGKKYNHSEKHYQYVQAKHQWQAAQYNYNATVQSFEMGFRTLYLKVKDDRQVLEAAEAALSIEESNYAVAQRKHAQGNLSQNALLEAEDKVKQAKENVDSAVITLFSSYSSYRWAADYGILN